MNEGLFPFIKLNDSSISEDEKKKFESLSQNEQEKRQEEQDQNGIDGDYDFSDYKMDEQLVDTDSNKESLEKITPVSYTHLTLPTIYSV